MKIPFSLISNEYNQHCIFYSGLKITANATFTPVELSLVCIALVLYQQSNCHEMKPFQTETSKSMKWMENTLMRGRSCLSSLLQSSDIFHAAAGDSIITEVLSIQQVQPRLKWERVGDKSHLWSCPWHRAAWACCVIRGRSQRSLDWYQTAASKSYCWFRALNGP